MAKRFAQCHAGDVVMSAITYAELEYGVSVSGNSARERRNLPALIEDIPVAPFDVDAAKAYGPIRKATRERKRDQLEKLIAAHAVSLKMTLVRNNDRNFEIYPGLKVENWLNE